MIDLLRRHVAILASLAIGWSGYSFYDSGTAKAETQAKGRAGGIDPAFLALRDPATPLAIDSDPYRLESGAGDGDGDGPGAPASATSGLAAVPGAPDTAAQPRLSTAELAQVFAGALREVAGEARELFTSPAASATAVPAAMPAAEIAPRPAGFTLVLQSTLDMATGAQARINGRTVYEGETMPFLDPLDPPLLRRVQGTGVIVAYAGRDYVADLLESPLLEVGDPAARAASPATAASTVAAPAKASQPAASKAPATGGAKPKPKGTYRVRGSSTKKKP